MSTVEARPEELETDKNPVLGKLRASKKNDALLQKFEGYFNSCQKSRRQFEQVWWTNMSFYFGRQYVQWVKAGTVNAGGKLVEPPAPPWRVRLISNKIRPLIRGELAKLTQEKPQPVVMPASSDDSDRIAARAAESIFEHVSNEVRLNKVLRQAIFWAVICGSSFIKDYFDATRKDSSGNMGSIAVERVSAFHLYAPDLAEEDIERQSYLIHASMRPVSYVKLAYPKTSKKVQGDNNKTEALSESKFLSAIGIKEQNKDEKQVLVKEIWIKPNAEYPNGMFAVWAEDQFLVEPMDWPYNYNEYPFTKIDHIPTGRFYGDSTIVDLIPLQKEYNKTRSQIIENKNTMSRPQLMAPRGSIRTSQLTSEPGLVIEYQPGFDPPTPLPLQGLPQYVIQEQERIQKDMDDISAQHEVSKGQAPPGIEAATAISFLQEQDDSKLSHTVASIEEAVEQIGRHILSFVVQYWTTARQIKVLGTSGFTEAKMLSGADLGNNVDLRVQSGSAMPRSRAAKQAFFMEIGKMAWLPPDMILKYLDLGEIDSLYEELQVDERQAQRENIKMRELAQQYDQQMATQPNPAMAGLMGGGMPQPMAPQEPTFTINMFDNHQMHVATHNRFRKTEEFELLSDAAKKLFNDHVMMHEQVMMQAQMSQMVTPGAPIPQEMKERPQQTGPPEPPGQPGPAPNSQQQPPVGS